MQKLFNGPALVALGLVIRNNAKIHKLCCYAPNRL
jgi:hypothetical protein